MNPHERPTDRLWSNAPFFIYPFIGIALAATVLSVGEAAWRYLSGIF